MGAKGISALASVCSVKGQKWGNVLGGRWEGMEQRSKCEWRVRENARQEPKSWAGSVERLKFKVIVS